MCISVSIINTLAFMCIQPDSNSGNKTCDMFGNARMLDNNNFVTVYIMNNLCLCMTFLSGFLYVHG